MTLEILFLIIGLSLTVFGADWLVAGASTVARRAGVSEFVIGLTIVGFGTSCPELVVSLTGAVQGNADISVGNVIGSNIFNTLLILGLTALFAPVTMTRSNTGRDVPIALMVSFILVFCGMSKTLLGVGNADGLSRVEGIVFMLIFASYMFYCFKYEAPVSNDESGTVTKSLGYSLFLIAAGLAGLVFGGQFFVDNAVAIARRIGVSDKFIAITLLAGGTSVPELATSMVAIARHKHQLALGNILGSNIFNILLILGTSALICPLSFASVGLTDCLALLLSITLVWIWTYTGNKNRIDRWEGLFMLLCFAAYYAYLFSFST